MYMDDSMDSWWTQTIKRFVQIMESAGMYARKWISKSVAVIKRIPKEGKTAEIDLRNEEFLSIKTLGIMWKSQDGILIFKYDSFR